jgi:hypothetical protein
MKTTISPQPSQILRYSPRPASAYQRYWHERQLWIGVGQLSFIIESPALWNLLWLSAPAVDIVLDEDLTIMQMPSWISAIEPCQKTILQDLGGVPVPVLLLSLPPLKFVDRILKHGPEGLAIYQSLGDDWIKTIKKRARLFGTDRPAIEALIPHNIKIPRRPSGNTFDLVRWLKAIAGDQATAK